MRYRRLGRTGLVVSELCLGTNTFGGTGFWTTLGGLGQAEATAVIKAAHESGVNFIDTADIYAGGESEERIAGALRDLKIARADVVIATKAGGRMAKGPNDSGLSRGRLIRTVEDSLRRLNTDYIDVYMAHFPDPATPLEETVRAFDELVRAGKIRYAGCSNYRPWQAQKAIDIAERYGLARFEIIETHWSAASRDAERELVPMCIDNGMGILAYGALLGGLLTGKFTRDKGVAEGVPTRTGGKIAKTLDPDRVYATIDALIAVAQRHNVKASQVALAWLLTKPAVTAALFGARSPEQVADNVGASDINLTAEDLTQLEATSPPVELHDGTTQNTKSMNDRLQYIR